MKYLILVIILILTIDLTAQNELIKKTSTDFNFNQHHWVERTNINNINMGTYGIKKYGKDSILLFTGYSYGEFYDWDLYFENLYLSYFGISEFCFSNLKEFLKLQHNSGFVSRCLLGIRPHQHFKPFMAQTILLGARQTGNYNWLLEKVNSNDWTLAHTNVSYYDRLKKYLDFWFWYNDFDKNGLPVWNSSDHSGMDNQISRAGKLNEFRDEGVDLACYLYRELKAMLIIATKLNFTEDAAKFNMDAEKLAAKINTVFWDDQDGFYYDRDERTGQLRKVKSVAGFMPLYVGIAPKDRAERLIKEHLINPNEFWITYPVASYAKTEPDYSQSATDWGCNWRGTTWIPADYMIFHGLMTYGYKDIAKQLVQQTLDLVMKANDSTREFYNGETGNGLGLNPFWGWSALGFLMPYEYELNYDPSRITDEMMLPVALKKLELTFPQIQKK